MAAALSLNLPKANNGDPLPWRTFAMADLCDGGPLRWWTFAMAGRPRELPAGIVIPHLQVLLCNCFYEQQHMVSRRVAFVRMLIQTVKNWPLP